MSVATAEHLTVVPSAGRQLPPSMLERMTLILDALQSSTSSKLTLEEVAQLTHLPRSTAHRILDQLVKLSWLEHTPAGYGLGHRAFALGGGDRGRGELRAAAAPLLHDLQLRTGMVVHLGVLDGTDVSYLDKLGGRFATAVPSRVGGRAPAHCTALGKALLAGLDAEDVDRLLGEQDRRRTDRIIGDLVTFHLELHRIRRRGGLAFERGECFPHIACAAAAVRGPEGPVAAISVVGDIQAPLERVAPLVVHAARQVSMTLFPERASARRRLTDRGSTVAARGPRASTISAVPTVCTSPTKPDTWSPETLNRLAAFEAQRVWF